MGGGELQSLGMFSRNGLGQVAMVCFWGVLLAGSAKPAEAPAASAARILLLPRRVISGERATLAVLDVSGRLTPGVTVRFSNGDVFKTDTTGRALFVAPLDAGMIFGSIVGRPGKVAMSVLGPTADGAAEGTEMRVASAPRVASLNDRFEISGQGFCGDADANTVRVGGRSALVLASSPAALVIFPPAESTPGNAAVEITCAKRTAKVSPISFVGLELEGDTAPLKPGEQRVLTVHISGTLAKVPLEARNLAPLVADLTGGNPARASSSGGEDNVARFDLRGRERGNFIVSIRLVPVLFHPAQ
ncbi:MAG: hypothetical protein NVS9B4_03700 [Candidatus Acidiferrum sp.]